MQKPRPLMMAMMYRRGRPKQLQSHSGGFFSTASRGRPSSVSSITSPVLIKQSQLGEVQQDVVLLPAAAMVLRTVPSLSAIPPVAH
ncbi:hypothetical protein FQN60_011012 [Etheostoma spectabile]|uniref:Uncharacterized protein n=1 Tax=Etheostoma spectabile TaxID=54343 RepID=A0A5J5DR43_9PERO|nr:hypothetical protein FQN60_011012 [Etheostoma spectabile]